MQITGPGGHPVYKEEGLLNEERLLPLGNPDLWAVDFTETEVLNLLCPLGDLDALEIRVDGTRVGELTEESPVIVMLPGPPGVVVTIKVAGDVLLSFAMAGQEGPQQLDQVESMLGFLTDNRRASFRKLLQMLPTCNSPWTLLELFYRVALSRY